MFYVYSQTGRMNSLVFICLCLFCAFCSEAAEYRRYHQTDYHLIPEKIDCVWVNESYAIIKQCEAIQFNQTYHKVYNVSLDLLKNVGRNLKIEVDFYKKVRSTYKILPIHVIADDLCREYDRNTYDVKQLLKQYTNLDPCPQKKGFIYMKHGDYDYSNLPPHIPRGNYKILGRGYEENDLVTIFEGYGSIVDADSSPYR